MALLNYTTTVEASKTAGEIQEMLRKHDAQVVIIEYGPGRQISGLSFEIDVRGKILSFRLPVQAES